MLLMLVCALVYHMHSCEILPHSCETPLPQVPNASPSLVLIRLSLHVCHSWPVQWCAHRLSHDGVPNLGLWSADPFLTYEEVRERGRSLLAENAPRSSPFLSRRSMLRGSDAGQSTAREHP